VKASVIVPTRDRADVLDACLASIAAQSLPREDFEVVVIDNGSTDHTAAVVARHASRLALQSRSEPEPGLHVGRHAGLRLARSDILVFADDDIVAEPTWLAAVVDAFADPAVALVGGNDRPLFERDPPAWLRAWWERPMRHGRALPHLSILDFGAGRFPIDPGYVWGCNYAIRRDALLAAGGFHPDGVPTDRLRWRGDGETHVSDWVRRSGRRTLFDGGASVGHRVPAARMTPEYFERRGYAQGISDSYTDLRRRAGAQARWVDRARRRARGTLARMLAAMRGPRGAAGRELRDVMHATQRAYLKGYDFHQREVRGDPALLDWVLREDYY
jgi:glycosyltransferase involved in cell wall biosynthesis